MPRIEEEIQQWMFSGDKAIMKGLCFKPQDTMGGTVFARDRDKSLAVQNISLSETFIGPVERAARANQNPVQVVLCAVLVHGFEQNHFYQPTRRP